MSPETVLTPTQQSILRMILAGKSNADIAHKMGWKTTTARARVCEILNILGISGGRRTLIAQKL